MLPIFHLFFGGIFSLIILFLFPFIGFKGFFIIFLSSIFIDMDHFIRYFILTKKLNPLSFYTFSREEYFKRLKNKNRKLPIFIFHGFEFLFIFLIFSFFEKLFIYLFWGFLFHLFLDYLDLLANKEPLYMKISPIYTHIKNKKRR
jgi:hypothetical protein